MELSTDTSSVSCENPKQATPPGVHLERRGISYLSSPKCLVGARTRSGGSNDLNVLNKL
jgi:hypothetical protein